MSSAFLWTNLALGLFNLLPVESLDGGKALASVLTPYRTARTVSRVVTVTSLCCLLPMATLGFWLLLISRWNVSLLLASVYLMFCLVLKERSPVY